MQHRTFQKSEQSSDSVSALSTRRKPQASRTEQRWDPTVCPDTADDNENDTSRQMPAPCRAKKSPPQKKDSMARPFYGRDSCDEKKIEKLAKNKNSEAAPFRLIGRTSPDLR